MTNYSRRSILESPLLGGASDVIADTLYDRQRYPASPPREGLKFFQEPIGQGTTTAPGIRGPKTEADTNMVLAGMLPTGQKFLMTAVEVIFLPAPGLSKEERVADVNAVARAGCVSLIIVNRRWMGTAPLASCPPCMYWHPARGETPPPPSNRDEEIRAALTEQFRDTDYGAFGGMPFTMVPVIVEATQPFHVHVKEMAQLPSGKPGQIWCRLPGRLIRSSF